MIQICVEAHSWKYKTLKHNKFNVGLTYPLGDHWLIPTIESALGLPIKQAKAR